jgi:hypothetical protein
VSGSERYLNESSGVVAIRGFRQLNRALSVAWLLAGSVAAGFSVGYLVGAGRLGWQSPAWTCSTFLSRSCQSVGMSALHDIKSALMTAAAGALLLLARRVAIKRAGLVPVRRGFVLSMSLMVGLVLFVLGLAGQTPALPDGVLGSLFWLINVPVARIPIVVGAIVLVECAVAAASCAEPRSTGLGTH